MHLSRRRFLALSATVSVAACTGTDDDEGGGATEPTATDTASTDTPTTAETPTTSTDTVTTVEVATTTTDPPAGVSLDADPFTLGICSGDPDSTSVVLWTRLTGELPDELAVEWEFTGDDGSTTGGTTTTGVTDGWSVHVVAEIGGPGTYRFRAGGFESPTGRTAPIDPTTTEFRFASAVCQHYETGHYAAHRDIAEWAPDLVVWLGDFIYEGEARPVGDVVVRSHEGPEPTDLAGYRRRYATYLADPQLRASRAAAPWLAIWDDHEVENNYAGVISQDDDPPDAFAARRLQAYRAWWEHMPTRLPPPTSDPLAPYVIYRGIDVGKLLRLSALDGRQFRDDQLANTVLDFGPPVEGWDDPTRTMLGAEQEAWLDDRFATSDAIWNGVVQQTVLSDVRLGGDGGAILNYDQWDGYVAARERLLAAAPDNLVVVTGDIHLAAVGTLGPPDEPVGVEFVTTATSSTPNVDPSFEPLFVEFPSLVDAELVFRGYTRHVVTPAAWTAEFRQVVDIASPDSEVRTWKTFGLPAGADRPTEVG